MSLSEQMMNVPWENDISKHSNDFADGFRAGHYCARYACAEIAKDAENHINELLLWAQQELEHLKKLIEESKDEWYPNS